MLSFHIRGLLLASLGLAAGSAVPYTDGACTQPIENYSYNTKNGSLIQSQPFDAGAGISVDHAESGNWTFATFKNITFDIPTSNKQIGSTVFWKLNDLGEGCRVFFFKPFEQPGQSAVPGMVVLSMGGSVDTCYPSTFTNADMHMSYCCGSGDCDPWDLGARELDVVDGPKGQSGQSANKGQTGQLASNGPSGSIASTFGKNPQANTPSKFKPRDSRTRGSISGRAIANARRNVDSRTIVPRDDPPKDCGGNATCFDQQWGSCKFTVTNDPVVSKPGTQLVLGSFEQCGANQDCQFERTNSNTYSFETSVSQGQSDTTGGSSSSSSSSTSASDVKTVTKDGFGVSVKMGVSFGPLSMGTSMSADHSTTQTNDQQNTDTSSQASSTSFSQTMSNQTTKGTTSSHAESQTQTLNIIPGGYAALSFTPFYDCYTVEVDCGSPWTWEIGPDDTHHQPTLKTELCSPVLNSDNSAHGSYDVLYTNPTG